MERTPTPWIGVWRNLAVHTPVFINRQPDQQRIVALRAKWMGRVDNPVPGHQHRANRGVAVDSQRELERAARSSLLGVE